ncbi:MAG: hypothetical protein R1F54_10145 [Candidatus Zeuxoniibacter abyssi]|nr:MAG: hypothetical protein R1F54_10145 [Candidatus Persebacteraceae bacterium AB1(2)]
MADFCPKTVTAAFDKWKTAYTGTVNALGKLRASVKSPKKWTPKIVYSGDVSALNVFSDVMTVSGAAIAAIGGITVNAQNKRHVQVHTRKVNSVIGTAPILFALYDQYQGHLYLHAYKSRRTTGKHVEVLHARLSPLHLDFLRGSHTDNPFRRLFYTADKPYRFNGIGFAGAITAAGQLAKHLSAAQVIIFAPLIDFDFTRIRAKSENKYKDLYGVTTTASIYIDTGENYATLKPRWFYGIPQVSGGDNKIGFTGAICATAGAPINAKDCDAKDFFPSYLAVMKVSRFPASYDDKVIKDKELWKYGYSKMLDLSAFPAGDIGGAVAGVMTTISEQRDIFSILNNMHANNILLEGYSGGNDFFTDASYVAESPSVYLERINGTLSDGHLSVTLLSLGASPQLSETKGVSAIILLMDSRIEFKDIAGTFGFESVKVLFSTGFVPRPDDFVPYAGGDLVAPRLLTEKVEKALKEARKAP